MSCNITNGRNTPCNNKVGGIKSIYFYNFSYSWGYFDVVISDEELLKVPADTMLYKYEVVEANFTETDKIEDEGIIFEQNLSISLVGRDYELMQIPNKLVSIVIEMYDGSFRALGVRNGLDSKITFESGGNYADLNGMKIEFNGIELNKAPYIYDLNSVGFIIDGAGEFLLLEDGFYLLQENGDKILL